MFGRRPIATSKSVPWMVSAVSPASTTSIRWRSRRTRSTLTPLRIVMPSRGVEYTVVNGAITWEQGKLNEAKAGKVLRG